MAIENVEYLIIAEKEFGEPVAFMGIDSNRLEMLFLSPEVRGKGLGKQLLQYGIETYNIQETNRIPRQSAFMSIWDFRLIKERIMMRKGIRIRFCI